MANDWTYRREDHVWISNQESRYQRRLVLQGTADIAAPLDTPRKFNARMMQQQQRYRTRRSLVHFGVNYALKRPHARQAVVYNVSLEGFL